MTKYDAYCENCGLVEIQKPMTDDFPELHECGGKLERRFGVLRIIYNSPGFFGYDHQMRRQMSSEKYDEFLKRRRKQAWQHGLPERE